MRSSYGEEAESRGTHRGVTEHEETQKSDDHTADRSPVRYDIGLHFFPSFCFTQVRGAGGVCRWDPRAVGGSLLKESALAADLHFH